MKAHQVDVGPYGVGIKVTNAQLTNYRGGRKLLLIALPWGLRWTSESVILKSNQVGCRVDPYYRCTIRSTDQYRPIPVPDVFEAF